MRWFVAGLVSLVSLSWAPCARAESGPPPPPVEQALATAKAENKVLVAEFSTVWCEPCRYLATRVLPNPKVQAALKQVVFVQYDAEKPPGAEAAARLRPEGFPTLIAVDAEGRELSRVVGVREAPQLSAWLRSLSSKHPRRAPHARAHAAH